MIPEHVLYCCFVLLSLGTQESESVFFAFSLFLIETFEDRKVEIKKWLGSTLAIPTRRGLANIYVE
jgi:hypothetical protein